MRHSRSELSKLHCLRHHDYLAKIKKLPEAAILTGTHLETVNERNAPSLTEDIVGIESVTETGTFCARSCTERRRASLHAMLLLRYRRMRTYIHHSVISVHCVISVGVLSLCNKYGCVVGHTKAAVAGTVIGIAAVLIELPTGAGIHTAAAEIVEIDIEADLKTGDSSHLKGVSYSLYFVLHIWYCTSLQF